MKTGEIDALSDLPMESKLFKLIYMWKEEKYSYALLACRTCKHTHSYTCTCIEKYHIEGVTSSS